VRLFTAIVPPAAAVAELEAATAPLRPSWPGLRWTGPDAWHLTLAFLGEVADGVVPALCTRLERAARRYPALELSIAGAGGFPRPARAHVVWAGIRAPDHAALTALARSVAAAARRAGAAPDEEGRRFRPHLTLARCREPADVGPLVDSLGRFAGAPWTARQIHLIRSQLHGRPRYVTVGSWELCSPGG
jgi:RNA 2',3'-cyclic 3'-phosphodiesterase